MLGSAPEPAFRERHGVILHGAGAFGSEDALRHETRAFVDFVRSSRPAEEGGAVMLPGEPERSTAADRQANGVPLTPETWAALTAAATAAGLRDLARYSLDRGARPAATPGKPFVVMPAGQVDLIARFATCHPGAPPDASQTRSAVRPTSKR
jgi:hypothetical protein